MSTWARLFLWFQAEMLAVIDQVRPALRRHPAQERVSRNTQPRQFFIADAAA